MSTVFGSAITAAGNSYAADSANRANKAVAEQTNATNKEIAEKNLGFQRENLEYQKALQQQIFDREDTALQRSASQLSSLGINPSAMLGSVGGSSAGEVVSTSPLHNDFQAQNGAPMRAATLPDFGSTLQSMYSLVSNDRLRRDQLNLLDSWKQNDNSIREFVADTDRLNAIAALADKGLVLNDDGSVSRNLSDIVTKTAEESLKGIQEDNRKKVYEQDYNEDRGISSNSTTDVKNASEAVKVLNDKISDEDAYQQWKEDMIAADKDGFISRSGNATGYGLRKFVRGIAGDWSRSAYKRWLKEHNIKQYSPDVYNLDGSKKKGK